MSMMAPLPEDDLKRLAKALEHFEMNRDADALREINNMTASGRIHPMTLLLRCRLAARANDWGATLQLAQALSAAAPDAADGPLFVSLALYHKRRPSEAMDILLPVSERFPGRDDVIYQIAKYACATGELKEAKLLLARVFGYPKGESLRAAALKDTGFEKLWPDIPHLIPPAPNNRN